ncbi:MAG: hypothetical protein WA323_09105 [Candidatus Nitrosopolaris sp.]
MMKGKIKAAERNFFENSDDLFNQPIKDYGLPSIKAKGQLLRKARRTQQRMNSQAKSELNITALLLPESYKLSHYYQTLSSEMDDKQKALAIRWRLERNRKNPDKFNPINRRTDLQRSSSDWCLDSILSDYYGRLSKREMYTCREILYSIWDSGDGHYDNIVSNLIKEHRPIFPTRRKADATIQRLINKGIISCKIYFRESRTDGLLKPKRILSLCKDVEIAAMSELRSLNEKDISWSDAPGPEDFLPF